MSQKRNHILGFAVGLVCLTLLDQWTKSLAVKSLIRRTEGLLLACFRENRHFSL